MFKSNRGREEAAPLPPAPPMPTAPTKRNSVSSLGADVTITGHVSASADLHIDGRVEGNVNCGTLAQGSESQIFGNVTADVARLAGAIEGIVRVRQLTVERTARISGDVEYENITIENGGHIEGRLKHMSTVQSQPSYAPPAHPINSQADTDSAGGPASSAPHTLRAVDSNPFTVAS